MKQAVRLVFYLAVLFFLVAIDKKLETIETLLFQQAKMMLLILSEQPPTPPPAGLTPA